MVTTRRANEEDVKAVAKLFDAYRVFYNKESNPSGALNFISERIQNNESVIFVTQNDNGELVGFVQLYPIFSSTRLKRLWLLNDLFIHPQFRSKGLSTALIEACKKFCYETNSCGMMLETAKDNVIGNNLYPRSGFVLDTAHNYYEWETRPEDV